MVDFSDCEVDITKSYGGSNGRKIGVIYEGEIYMLKFPQKARENSALSYQNISEYIACHIINSIGLHAQDTLLGYYDEKIVVACKDFEGQNKRMLNFGMIKNSILDTNGNPANKDLEDTIKSIENQKLIDKNRLKSHFWDMFIADTFLANSNRHNENWGLMLDKNRNIQIAPIYGCKSSLYPKLSDLDIKMYLENEDKFDDLMQNLTTSAITKNGEKLNPQNFLLKTKDENVLKALDKITKQIDLKKIDKIIDDIKIISSDRKSFYKQTIKARRKILEKARKNTFYHS